jgi:hypothetical protein
LVLFANAQEKAPKTPALKTAKQTKVSAKQLNLTNSLITRVNAVLLAQNTSIDSSQALKGTNDKKEQKYSHKLIHDRAAVKLKSISPPEQQTKYTAFAAAKKEQKAAGKKRPFQFGKIKIA